MFADGRSGIVSREVYVQLAELDPRVRLHWVMAGVGNPLWVFLVFISYYLHQDHVLI